MAKVGKMTRKKKKGDISPQYQPFPLPTGSSAKEQRAKG
jgi:hypothetical protein